MQQVIKRRRKPADHENTNDNHYCEVSMAFLSFLVSARAFFIVSETYLVIRHLLDMRFGCKVHVRITHDDDKKWDGDVGNDYHNTPPSSRLVVAFLTRRV